MSKVNNSKQLREEKKYKKLLAKKEKLRESLIQTKLDSWELSKRIEASEQLISAHTEQKLILERMIELVKNDKKDSPEYKQLLDRYKMLETFGKRQSMLYDAIGIQN